MPQTDETRIALFIAKVKDLAHRSQQDPVLVAIGFVYVILVDILEAVYSAAGSLKGLLGALWDRENKP